MFKLVRNLRVELVKEVGVVVREEEEGLERGEGGRG